MIAKIIDFVKKRAGKILLFLLIFLAVLLLFGISKMVYFYSQKPPLLIENEIGD